MIAIYARKSQENKDKNTSSIEEQIHFGKECAKNIGVDFIIYNEGILSGALELDKRPQFLKMLTDINDKGSKITAVFAYDSSRLYRNDATKNKFLAVIQKKDIGLHFKSGVFDWKKPENALLFSILSATDQFFVDLTSQKIRDKLKRNVEQGKVNSGHLPYGYTKDKNKYLIIHPEEAKIVRLIFKKFIEGNTAIQIRNHLNTNNVPTRQKSKNKDSTFTHPVTKTTSTTASNSKAWRYTTITGIIKNTIYKGERIFNNEVYNAPIIIPPIEWEKANKLFKPKRGKNTEHRYLLTPLLQCGCGKLINGRSHKIENYYVCGGKRVPKHDCNGKYLPEDLLNSFVTHLIYDKLYDTVKHNLTGNNDQKKTEIKKQLQQIAREITNIKASQKRIEDDRADGIFNKEQFHRQYTRLQGKLKEATIKEANIKEQIKSLNNSTDILNEIKLIQTHNVDFIEANYSTRVKEMQGFVNSIKAEVIESELPFNDRQAIIRKYIKNITITYYEEEKTNKIVVEYKLPIPNETYYIKKGNKSVTNKAGSEIILNSRLLKKSLNAPADEELEIFIQQQTNPDDYYAAIDKHLNESKGQGSRPKKETHVKNVEKIVDELLVQLDLGGNGKDEKFDSIEEEWENLTEEECENQLNKMLDEISGFTNETAKPPKEKPIPIDRTATLKEMIAFLRTYIKETYGDEFTLPKLTPPELINCYELALAGEELPIDDFDNDAMPITDDDDE